MDFWGELSTNSCTVALIFMHARWIANWPLHLHFPNYYCIWLIVISNFINPSYIRIIKTEFVLNIFIWFRSRSNCKISQTFSLNFSAKLCTNLALFFIDSSSTSVIEDFGSKIHELSCKLRTVEACVHQWQLKIPARSCMFNTQTFIQIIIWELRNFCSCLAKLESMCSSSALQLRLEFDSHDSWN